MGFRFDEAMDEGFSSVGTFGHDAHIRIWVGASEEVAPRPARGGRSLGRAYVAGMVDGH